MAQTVDQIIRQQLGNLLVEVAALTAQLQERDELIAKLQAEKQVDPDGPR